MYYQKNLSCSYIQGFFYRLVGQNRRPPVAVNRTGLTGYRKKPAKFKIQTKNSCSTGFYRLANRFDRLSVGLSGNRSNLNFFV